MISKHTRNHLLMRNATIVSESLYTPWGKLGWTFLPSVHFFFFCWMSGNQALGDNQTVCLSRAVCQHCPPHLPAWEDATCAWCLHHCGSLFWSASTSGSCLCSVLITKHYRFSKWQGTVTYQHWNLNEKPLLILLLICWNCVQTWHSCFQLKLFCS